MRKHSVEVKGTQYSCVRCRGNISAPANLRRCQWLECESCGKKFPVIQGLPVFYRAPLTLLEQFEETNLLRATSLKGQSKELRNLQQNKLISNKAFAAGRRLVVAQEKNHALISKFTLSPSRSLRATLERDQSASRLETGGWDPAIMLDYFYRDWCRTSEEQLAYLIIKKLLDQSELKTNSSLAVLGCGAGGLLYRLASRFDRSYGIDLSLPILALARRVSEGASFKFWKTFPQEGETIPIQIEARSKRNISWVAADALDLPFADESLDCVVSQHLFDIVPDRSRFAMEVHRVLRPGGIWIEFSHGGFQSSVDQYGRHDLRGFLKKENFRVAKIERKALPFLDFSRLRPTTNQQLRTTVIFSAAKIKSSSVNEIDQAFYAYFRRTSSRVLAAVPSLNKNLPKNVNPSTAKILECVDGRRSVQKICQKLGRRTPAGERAILCFLQEIFRSNSITIKF